MSEISPSQATAHAHRLKGQTIILTGAASGIGRAIALKFASYGANLVLGDLAEDGLKKVADEIKQAGGSSVWAVCDVTRWEDQVELFALGQKS